MSSGNPDVPFNRVAELGDDILDLVNMAREMAPIFWSERLNAWVVTGHKECLEAFGDKLPLSTARMHKRAVAPVPEAERATKIPYLLQTLPSWVVNVDAPVHTRLRRLMMKAFSRKAAENQRHFVRQVIRETFAAAPRDGEFDLVEHIARPITARVILHLLGLDEDLLPQLKGWSAALNGAFGGQPPTAAAIYRAEAALLEMRALFLAELVKRRAEPGEDFLSQLVTARDDHDQLSEEEMLGICYVTLIAGHDTTMNTIALGTNALSNRPEALNYIKNNHDNITNIVLEIMRFIAMSFSKVRAVSSDFNWHGHELREGQYIYVTIAGANRDPSVWNNPEDLDFTRSQTPNATFAPGLHHCIGHWVAKVELEEYFMALAEQYQPEVMDRRLQFAVPSGFRGLEHLNVKLHARA